MTLLSIAWKDLQILVKDRNNLIVTFLLPVIFVVVFLGVAGASSPEEEEEKLIPLPVVNLDLDGSGETAGVLVQELRNQGGLDAFFKPEDEAMALLEDEEVHRILYIPEGFQADLDAGKNTELRFVHDGQFVEETSSVMMAVQGVTQDLSLEQQIIASLRQLSAMQGTSAEPNTLPAEAAIPLAQEQFKQARARPLVTVEQERPSVLEEKPNIELGIQVAVPGFAVLFVFLTAQTTARSIYEEKKTGTFRRLMAAPLGNYRMLLGKMLTSFLVVILQMVFLFATGMYILPLLGYERLDLGSDIPALIILVLVVAICSTTLGILIASVAKTEAQIGGISGVVLWVLAILGGSFIPIFLINETMDALGKVTPHYWAVTGFYNLLTRGQGLDAITTSLAVLAGFSAAFFIIGAWRFDFE